VATTASRSLNTPTDPQAGSVVFWRDAGFWLAVLAGPLCWILLWVVGLPGNVSPPDPLVFVTVAVAYPILEEIVFRGGVQPALLTKALFTKRIFGLTLANATTSLLFAAAHLLNQPPLWAMLVIVPSLVFGWARDRYQRILPSILLHMLYNAGFVWLFVARAGQ